MKTLRGHEQDVTAAVVIAGGKVNWENPSPPLVVSLSADGCVKAWDIMQVWVYNSYTYQLYSSDFVWLLG